MPTTARKSRMDGGSSSRATDSRTSDAVPKLAVIVMAVRLLAGHLDVTLPLDSAASRSGANTFSKNSSEGIARLLLRRLSAARDVLANASIEVPQLPESTTAVSAVQAERLTGASILPLLQALHDLLDEYAKSSEADASSSKGPIAPALGARDLKALQTVVALFVGWHLSRLIRVYDLAFAALHTPRKQSTRTSTPRFVELSEPPVAQAELASARVALVQAQESLSDLLPPMLMGRTPMPTASTAQLDAIPQAQHFNDVSTALVHTALPSLLSLAVRLAFGPLSVGAKAYPQVAQANSAQQQQAASLLIRNVLGRLSTSSAFAVLSGSATSATPNGTADQQHLGASARQANVTVPLFVRSATKRLLGAQLLRPGGVRALLDASLGVEDAEPTSDAHIRGMERVATLCKTPVGMPLSLFLEQTMPQLLSQLAEIFDPTDEGASPPPPLPPPSHSQAAAYTLSKLCLRSPSEASVALHIHLWDAFCPSQPSMEDGSQTSMPDGALIRSVGQIRRALNLMQALLQYAPPGAVFVSFVVKPIVPQLVTLQSFLEASTVKGKARAVESLDEDKRALDIVKELLGTWGRLADVSELVETLGPGKRGLLERVNAGIGEPGADAEAERQCYWAIGPCIRFGSVARVQGDLPNIMADLAIGWSSAGSMPSDDITPNVMAALGLLPISTSLVKLLKESSRVDASAKLLTRLLETYRANESAREVGVGKRKERADVVLLLQTILGLIDAFQQDLLKGETGSVLTFIDFALADASRGNTSTEPQMETSAFKAVNELPMLRPASSDEPNGLSALMNIGSTRQSSGASAGVNFQEKEVELDDSNDELVSVALELLLALLEGHPELKSTTTPLLRVIEAQLSSHKQSKNSDIRRLASEARLVLTARGMQQASTAEAPGVVSDSEAAQRAKGVQTYQEALRLLQDPILPVRAHGLTLLTSLVSAGSVVSVRKGPSTQGLLDPALTPAVLDIFIQAVQDDESFLYLNAVKGLAAMVDVGGVEMLCRLVKVYIGGKEREGMKESDLNMRLRIGEALLQVIKHAGQALAPNISLLFEPLLSALSDATLPTNLRSSIISLMGTLVEASPWALAAKGHSGEMATAMLDLLALEIVPRVRPLLAGDTGPGEAEVAQASPTSTDRHLPQLRRSATLLLALLIRGTRHQLEEYMGRAAESAQGSETDGVGLQALRLPGGGALPSLTSAGGSAAPGSARQTHPLLFPSNLIPRARTTGAYASTHDADALVRLEGEDIVNECGLLELALVNAGLSR